MNKISFLKTYPPGKVNYLFEIITAIILSLSTVASAWSAYQSGSWYKVEKDLLFESSQLRSESLRSSSAAMQYKAIDVSMFLEFAQAYSQDNTQLSDFIYQRFRPGMRVALDPWMALDPMVNPTAPAAPFYMEEYVLAQDIAAEDFLVQAEEKTFDAGEAAENSNTYSKLTVLFAATLFFAGITTKFESQRIRVVMVILAILSFSTGLIVIITSPIK
ncbi:MAG TPA: hypothetical protein VK856_06675 [Anaerolineaceae bacterium]|nr:hypothetical protein [Anaerolineaceae bacterium]